MYNDFENFCFINNIYISYKNIPYGINGFSYCYGDKYLVVINCKENTIQQRNTTIHELIHIFENHFILNEVDLEMCENDVKELINKIKNFDIQMQEEYIVQSFNL